MSVYTCILPVFYVLYNHSCSLDKPVAIKKSRFGEMEREVGQCGSVVDNIMPALTSSVRTYKA